MSTSIQVRHRGDGVCLIGINRPERRNALDTVTYVQLGEALQAADDDVGVRAIVLTGEGGHFTAGNDLADFQRLKDADAVPGIGFLRILATVSKPVVAAVEGYAIGIGTTLLLHCDLAYAGRSSKFRLPFVGLGLCPEGASTYLLPRLAGSKVAANLLFFGEPFLADTAREIGLLNEVVEDGTALERAIERAEALARLPVQALATTKRLLVEQQRDKVGQIMDAEEKDFLRCCAGQEAQTAFSSFFAKK
ncbi:TPA: enoyl-CoA hydratase [Pseudomonas aeruginosa]|nr:enoyl-CoA hydratase [Pseudomonas aeruginosa]MBA1263092.1 enoyl-CoA hydratase [Stutzerimonas stutzeri]MBG0842247.1 enoyl-CoA hydratase/isomerase family protein [Pseudomonas toyotomiensis]RRU92642.1 enoyl-CoA hydratase [Stutzerimonas xanthomarina]KSG99997.1 enoyl-CoA hydratase [Pseudomonas aeruginosa]